MLIPLNSGDLQEVVGGLVPLMGDKPVSLPE